ncbi:PilZ domain-containing protein [Anaeromyxobacter oryzae]|uniref:Response regulatory domain-containing protein n=1 Tax=Anaeromyxobacter oryzae TaxID=2918170 RepID=A0ABM7X3B8_9BACT|nr:PilZ domain-containing protein [Anaeromyxobacter oryzae]BDG06256.1 hypothetical protein AMOR_52520 [Anaeromyxobacter oryzae]
MPEILVGCAPGIGLKYASATDVRRDRLADERHGVLVRTKLRLAVGDRTPVTIELEKERIAIQATGEIRWVTPLVNGALAGIALVPASHRDGVQLDLVFGVRSAGPAPERAVPPPAPIAAAAAAALAPGAVQRQAVPEAVPPLSVAMLQPNPVLRQALVAALGRFGREKGPWDVSVQATAEPDAFIEALSAEPRGLAIIDCDPLGAAVDPLVAAIRSHRAWERLPLILLSSDGRSRLEDGYAVFVRKPFEVKSFVNLAGILVARA